MKHATNTSKESKFETSEKSDRAQGIITISGAYICSSGPPARAPTISTLSKEKNPNQDQDPRIKTKILE